MRATSPQRAVIQSLWVGRRLSTLEKLSILSFVKNGHPFHLYAYDDIAGLPAEVELKDANTIVTESEVFAHRGGFGEGSFAGFSDYFRYLLLYKLGGWWVDLDMVCIKPFELSDSHVVCSYFENHKLPSHPGNCVLKAPAGSPLMAKLVEGCLERADRRNNYGAFGVRLVKMVIDANGWNEYTYPREYFCPINWTQIEQLVEGPDYLHHLRQIKRYVWRQEPLGRVTKYTYAIHFFQGTWMARKWSPDDKFHSRSIIEVLKKHYLATDVISKECEARLAS